jgi:hypothetical protein
MVAFRNTRNCGIPRSTQEGHSFLKDSLGDKTINLSFMILIM